MRAYTPLILFALLSCLHILVYSDASVNITAATLTEDNTKQSAKDQKQLIKVLGIEQPNMRFHAPAKDSVFTSENILILLEISDILSFPVGTELVLYRKMSRIGVGKDRAIQAMTITYDTLEYVGKTDRYLNVTGLRSNKREEEDFYGSDLFAITSFLLDSGSMVTDEYYFVLSVSEWYGQRFLLQSETFQFVREGVQHDLPGSVPVIKNVRQTTANTLSFSLYMPPTRDEISFYLQSFNPIEQKVGRVPISNGYAGGELVWLKSILTIVNEPNGLPWVDESIVIPSDLRLRATASTKHVIVVKYQERIIYYFTVEVSN
ncbi:hypothetical protein MP638_007300 [Amoeboaphelidium occidentale]|nr:hypothetical protein MP638_007300 [Amoeboaphelidium occidentale]